MKEIEKRDLELINDYINSEFINTDNYHLCLLKMDKLSHFIDKHDYYPRVDNIVDLLNNDLFNNCTKTIYEKNSKVILAGNGDMLFRNSFISNVIDIYCMVNNIDIDENIDCGETDSIDIVDGLTTYINDIRSFKVLSFEEEQELAKRIKENDIEAKKMFVECNLKLVIKFAKKYQNRGVSLQDLIQEGNIGLLIAINKFDPNRGFKFSTYAYNWIKQSFIRAISSQSNMVKVPEYIIKRYHKFIALKNKLAIKLDREPTIEELAKELNVSVDKIIDLHYMQFQTISLDSGCNEDKDLEYHNIIPDPNVKIEDEIINRVMQEDVYSMLKNSNLNEREIKILIYRYGLCGKNIKTYDEIGSMYNITRQRVQQIENRALEKLRLSENIIGLEAYMESSTKTIKRINKIHNLDEKDNIIDLEYKNMLDAIYDVFKLYTKEEINSMLGELTIEERKLLKKRFGNINKIDIRSATYIKEKNIYYNELLPKMRRFLEIIHYNNMEKKKNSDKKVLYPFYKDAKLDLLLRKISNKMDNDDYFKLLAILSGNEIMSLLSKYNPVVILSILLCLGYINEKYYTISEIANIVGKNEIEIIKIIKDTMQECQDEIINVFDEVVNKTLKK